MNQHLQIKTQTTGFGSPARSYIEKRLDTNDLLVENHLTTFYFKWEGEPKFGLEFGDHLIVDRSKTPIDDDLVVVSTDKLEIDLYKNIDPTNLWGVITWKLCKLKK